MLLGSNESICIQGAFFLLYAGGSKTSGDLGANPVVGERGGGGWGGSESALPKADQQEQSRD